MILKGKLLPVPGQYKYGLLLLFCLSLWTAIEAQDTRPRVNGIVQNEKGEPLENASVSVSNKKTNFRTGTFTNAKGEFSISSLPEGGPYRFFFSSVGYEVKEMNGYMVSGTKRISLVVRLKAEDKSLSQVVVVGYGTRKKEDITGAINQTGKDVFENHPVTNVGQALQGVIPNLNISFGDGQLNRGATFNIRGFNSINGGSPLILIDGVEGDINLINPEDIASVSVLKDAASAAIYGARASFGVILVTTKKGQKSKIAIRYSDNIGYGKATYLPHVITDPLAAAELQNLAYKGYAGIDNSGMLPIINYLQQRKADPTLPETGINTSNNTWLFGANTDWYKAFYSDHQAFSKHYLNISGGSDKMDFFLSGGMQSQDGAFKVATDTYKRYNFRSKLGFQAFDWLRMYNNSEFNQGIYNTPNKFVNGNYNIYRYLSLFASPYYSIKTPNGNYTQAGMLTFGDLTDGGREIEKSQIFRNTTGFQAKFFGNSFRINGDFTAMWTQDRDDRKARTLKYESSPGVISNYSNKDFYQSSYDEAMYTVTNLYAEYENTFYKHHLDILAGVNQELNKDRQFQGSITNNLSDQYGSLNLASGTSLVSDNNSDWAVQGLFSRLAYNYDHRYMLEFNGRYDGTSRFPSSDRYGFFPSVSAGWLVSHEKFFEPVKNIFSSLKLRGSYGSLGNQQVSNYAYIPTMSFGQITNIINGIHPIATSAPGLVSSNLTWETARTLDFGTDMALLQSRLELGFDWYNRRTINMLTKSKQLPAVLGTTEPKTNAADLSTYGWELSFKWQDEFKLLHKPFRYNITVVVSDNTTRITKYDNPNKYLGDYYAGQKVGEIWGYETDGFFSTDDAYKTSADQSKVSGVSYSVDGHPMAGDIRFKDLNGDKLIYNGQNTVTDHGDMKIIGNNTPRYAYGVNLGASWYHFDLGIFFQGIGKRDLWPGVESGIFWGFYNRWNQPVYDQIYGNYWTPTHTDAYFPRPRAYIASASGNSLTFPQTRYLQNAAYLRLKNITMGYSFSPSILSRVKISSLRLFASGQNLLTWTKLSKAFDPETIGDDPDTNTSNGNGFVYPIQKTFTVGMDLTF